MLPGRIIQLIDEEGRLNFALEELPESEFIVTIFGTQSSGKSTLLNYAYDCTFEVLNAKTGRNRCTKGIMLQTISNILIIDSQGFDSLETTTTGPLEQQLTLFCFALSDVIIVNLFMNEVGRHFGGHIDMLKIIRENVGVLGSIKKKKIVFVIRDWEEEAEKEFVKDYVENMFEEVFRRSGIVFEIQYVFLRHFVYNKEGFKEDVGQLKTTTSVSNSQMGSLAPKERLLFVRELWRTILESKKINLKSIRDAVILYSFEQVELEIIKIIQKEVNEGQINCSDKTFLTFVDTYKLTIKKLVEERKPTQSDKEQTTVFIKKIFEKISPLLNEFYKQNVAMPVAKSMIDRLKKEYENELMKRNIGMNFGQLQKKVLNEYEIKIRGHCEYDLLMKELRDGIGRIELEYKLEMLRLEGKVERNLEKELKKLLQTQCKLLKFSRQQVNAKLKFLIKNSLNNEILNNVWERTVKNILNITLPTTITIKAHKLELECSKWYKHSESELFVNFLELEQECEIFVERLIDFPLCETRIDKEDELIAIKDKIFMLRTESLNKVLQEKESMKTVWLTIIIILLLLKGELTQMLELVGTRKRIKKIVNNLYYPFAFVVIVYSAVKYWLSRDKSIFG